MRRILLFLPFISVTAAEFHAEIRAFVAPGRATSVALVSDAVYAAAERGLLRCAPNPAFRPADLIDRSGAYACAVAAPQADLVAAAGDGIFFTSGQALYRLASGKAVKVADLPPGVKANHLAAGRTVLLATETGAFDRISNSWKQVPLVAGASVRQAAFDGGGRAALAASAGLYLRDASSEWKALSPREGNRSWAPVDVRGVAFDRDGRLWFASPQGVGCLDSKTGAWRLWTTGDGLPYDDFTAAEAGDGGAVWFATTRGAIRFDGQTWEYRQGKRWLAGDEVHSVAVGPGGDAWFATSQGLSVIERRPITLAEKAKFFEEEIDKRHRRTEFEYVLGVSLKRPGDKSEWVQHDSDNDGLWTSMYGAGQCYAFAATGDPKAKQRAQKAFEAMRHLRLVTQGGSNPAPPGFVARAVLPASGPDPNLTYTLERDRERRATRDSMWKVIAPRWPKSADGKWYWKTDTSSDELDGHFWFYGLYYDLVAKTDEERAPVREHVAAIADHLLDHNFCLVDHDGLPTRWAIFNPENLNHNRNWWQERGMNSASILAYLKVAAHVTGNAKYEEAARKLVRDHGYGMNVLIPKTHAGPGAGNQSDDEMIFMNFYNLVRYKTDPDLAQKYAMAFHNAWRNEEPELNPLFNFMYAALCAGKQFTESGGAIGLSPTGGWLEESVDTLERYPLDRINWGLRNSHRKDIVPLGANVREGGRTVGHRNNGRVLPIDERFVEHWNHDPWALDYGGTGNSLADGNSFLLPYYMGRYFGFIK